MLASHQINKNINSLVLLRGIAVIMVCFCHFGFPLSNGHLLADLFKCFNNYGKYGVHVFFVISGFVIPLSFFKGQYNLSDYTQFLYKRVLRLHPPYLAALAITLIIVFLSYKVRHVSFPETVVSISKSLIYFHAPADNPVFWTLAVEAQYYLFIGLFYAALIRYPKVALCIITPVLIVLSQTYVANYISLLSYIVFFLIGTVGFLIYTDKGIRNLNFIAIISLLTYSVFFYGAAAFIAAFLTISFIFTYRGSAPQLLQFPGKISYSIYLIHFPIGIKMINLAKPHINLSYSWFLFIAAMVVTIVASWLFYKVFEDYSEKLSRKVKYKAATNKESDIFRKQDMAVV